MTDDIPQADPGAFVRVHRKEIDAALARVLDTGRFVLGPEEATFEAEFGAYLGVRHVVGVASGTEALWLALLASGVGPGDEVIIPSLTASATAAAVVQAGAIPVFADVRSGDLNLDPEQVERCATSRTRAVIPVHLYGNPADLSALLGLCTRRGLLLIEDCAQAHGASLDGRKVGTFGSLAAFSFYPTKNLGGFGDGGAVTTNDSAHAEQVRLLREYGWRDRYSSTIHGWNSRLDELQAAILRVKLAHLTGGNERRRQIAETYRQELDAERFPLVWGTGGGTRVFHLCVIRTSRRAALTRHLADHGVGTAVHYPIPVHLQRAYTGYGRGPGSLPVTENACQEILSLPMYPELTNEQVAQVVEAVNAFGSEGRSGWRDA